MMVRRVRSSTPTSRTVCVFAQYAAFLQRAGQDGLLRKHTAPYRPFLTYLVKNMERDCVSLQTVLTFPVSSSSWREKRTPVEDRTG